MLTRNFTIDQMPDYFCCQEYDVNKTVYFDIETTGLSANTSYLYLIGCAYYKESSFHILQWFSESIKEEALLISSFFNFILDYQYIFHYNGSGFDIPYLLQKCNMLHLDYSFEPIISIDLYKKISPYKKLLHLENLKQKSIETFLNIKRKDILGGEELIQIYQSYLGKSNYEKLIKKRNPELCLSTPTEAELLLEQLLLHNEDDLRGLVSITPILSYVNLFEKPVRIQKASVAQNYFTIQFEISASLPVQIQYKNDLVHIIAIERIGYLTIPVYEGELKHFYDNYQDYYYLPSEDTAIHKSLAQFVDKKHRVKAKPSTCYNKKQGVFAPQYEYVLTPYFKIEYKDKISFVEIHTDNLLQEANLEQYVRHILSTLA